MINNNFEPFENYYKILEINNKASLDDIKKAYRRLSLKYHPDRNDNNTSSTFNEITTAYEYLTKNYNKILTKYSEPNISSNKYNKYNEYSQLNTSSNSIYNESNNDYIDDLEINIHINFKQSYSGTNIPINISREIINNNYKKYENETLYVEIPKGIDNNEIIIIKNKGNIKNYKYGDLKIIVVLDKEDLFVRDGLNIIYTKQISFKESLTGVNFILTHINNKKYKIITNNGEVLTNDSSIVLSQLGFNRNNYCGDLIIKFIVDYPKQLNHELITQLKVLL